MLPFTQQPRTRAWFFITVANDANPVAVAKDIYVRLGTTHGENCYVLVRADVVSNCQLGEIIAPIDAIDGLCDTESGQSCIDKAKEDIEGVAGVASTTYSVVTKHNPVPPHEAFGYVNEEEMETGLGHNVTDVKIAGVQSPYSPGSNKWG